MRTIDLIRAGRRMAAMRARSVHRAMSRYGNLPVSRRATMRAAIDGTLYHEAVTHGFPMRAYRDYHRMACQVERQWGIVVGVR